MKQNNQSSWAARLRKLSALCLMLVAASSAWADNNLTIKPNIEAGKTGKIAISLDNETAYTAFQMEIKLPKGLTIAKTGAMDIAADRKNLHQVPYNLDEETGVVRVAAYSFDGNDGNKVFNEKSGNLLNITLTATDEFKGGNIEVSGITFVDANLNGVTGGFKVANADVNQDCLVDTQDALKAIGYYLEGQYVSSADVNADNAVDTQDALKIIGIYLSE